MLEDQRTRMRTIHRLASNAAWTIPAYCTTIADADSKKRYADKLELVNGIDPYEIPMNEWQDNVDLWPAITHVHVCMYLILSASSYTKEDLLNYKSLDCYQNFAPSDLPPHSSCETASISSHGTSLKYCYCQEGEHGKMVGCDNPGCPYQWFHLECLRLKSVPRSKSWYFPDCRKHEKFKKNK